MREVLVTFALVAASSAIAQPSLDGKWTATFSTGGSDTREAEIRIAGQTGTWTTRARPNKDRNDPCIGRAFPIAVTSGDSGRVIVELKASAEISGCRDRKADLTLTPSGALEGKLDNGNEIRLTR